MVIWCLMFALLLLPIGGLSIDLWHAVAVQRQLQAEAEDAALAGASAIDVAAYRATGCLLLDPSLAVGMAHANLARQQGEGELTSSQFLLSADRRSLEVVLKKDVSLTLLRLVEGDRPLVVTADASSTPVGSVTGAGC